MNEPEKYMVKIEVCATWKKHYGGSEQPISVSYVLTTEDRDEAVAMFERLREAADA